MCVCRARTRQTVRAVGGKIPLSFDYVISAQHIEEPVPPSEDVSATAAPTNNSV